MKTAILIPAHNEARTIAGLVESVRRMGYEAVVIDDGSQDESASLAKSKGAILVQTPRRSGKGGALQLGFSHCLQAGFDAVVLMDGDGQHAPEDLAAFMDCYRKTKADIICGNRMRDPQGMPGLRLATNRFMSWLISLICRQRIEDTQCGFRFLRTEVLKDISIESTDFQIETEILIRASRKGFKIASVPVATIYRDEKSKIDPLRDTGRFIVFIIKELCRRDRG